MPDPNATTTASPSPEDQRRRWVKYGANVALSVVLVVVLSILVVYLAQRYHARADTTLGGMYSLKPQTLNIVKDLKQKVELVGLYPRPDDVRGAQRQLIYRQRVADLLDEYAGKSSKISAEMIDPDREFAKVDALIGSVSQKYGGLSGYKQMLQTDFPAFLTQMRAFADAQIARMRELAEVKSSDRKLLQTMDLASATVQSVPEQLAQMQKDIDRELKRKEGIPDYKGAVEDVRRTMELLGRIVEKVATDLTAIKANPQAPPPVQSYAADAAPKFTEQKKSVDAVVEKIKKLGDLKLDELRRSLKQGNNILVMGEKDVKVLSFPEVWPEAENPSPLAASDEDENRPTRRFAGEQQVTTALVSLEQQKKPKVAFIRASGPALTTPGIPGFMPGGPFGQIAGRLRNYNFEVLEKNFGPPDPRNPMGQAEDPSDEDLASAVWVVPSMGNMPQQQQMGMSMPPSPVIAEKLKEHLTGGGSALCLFLPEAQNLSEALGDWGIDVKTNAIIVHEKVMSDARPGGDDWVEQAQNIPWVFITTRYGDHPITQPLKSLESVLVPMLPVMVTDKPGYKATRLIPVPEQPKAWGETDTRALRQGSPKFDPASDVSPPLNAMAVVEKTDSPARLVVIGAESFVFDQTLNILDDKQWEQGRAVSRFPGNAELFANSVYWLARLETLIAISPSAMEIGRIEPMSDRALGAVRIGILLIGLPALVVVAGGLMYLKRRD